MTGGGGGGGTHVCRLKIKILQYLAQQQLYVYCNNVHLASYLKYR